MPNPSALTAGDLPVKTIKAGDNKNQFRCSETDVSLNKEKVASYTVDPLMITQVEKSERASKPKRTSRRRLRGEVTVVYSTRVHFQRLHIDENCETLEKTPENARARMTFPNAWDLGCFDRGRPCRVCCLEPVLRAVLKARGVNPVRVPVLFTASAQACPSRDDVNLRTYKWAEASDSAEQRLRRVARTVGLPTLQTAAGLVIYGVRSQETVNVIQLNLRTASTKVVSDVSEETIQTLWTLLNDNPPELMFEPFPDDVDVNLDLWKMASMLCR
jgi:hypothetical protein